VLWSLAERTDGVLLIEHPYFETDEPLVWDEGGTYVETDAVFESTTTHEWNHGLGEIFGALKQAGLNLTMLVEHQSAPLEIQGFQMERADDGWRLTDRPWRLPLTYTVRAVKPPA
jgi:hypothetical protein